MYSNICAYYQTNKEKILRILNFLLMLGYVAGTIILVVTHEPWRDEAQAWLISKDLSFVEMLGQMRYEGHPPLWAMLLMPFAKAGLPYPTIKLISWVLMLVAAWLLVYRSPLNIFVKGLILISTPFFYSYAAVARSYALIPPILFLIAVVYPNKKQHPLWYGLLIALLANTHILMAGTAGMLAGFWFLDEVAFPFFKEKQKPELKTILGMVICAAGILFMVGLLMFTPYEIGSGEPKNIKDFLVYTHGVLYGGIYTMFGFKILDMKITMFVFAGVIALCAAFWRWWRPSILFAVTFLYQLLFYYLTNYGIIRQRAEMLLVIGIFCIWIGFFDPPICTTKLEKHKKYWAWGAQLVLLPILLLSVKHSYYISWQDWRHLNSGSQPTAQFILQQQDENAMVVALNDASCTALVPYLEDVPVYNPTINKTYRFVSWGEERKRIITTQELYQTVQTLQEQGHTLYVVASAGDENCTGEANLSQEKWLTSVYNSGHAIMPDEQYTVYTVK